MKAIVREIEVHVSNALKRIAEDIAATVVARLDWNVSLPLDRIVAKVSNDAIPLIGEVYHRFGAEAAEGEPRQLYNVAELENRTTLVPRSNLGREREHQRGASPLWPFDTETVTVTAEGGTG